MHRPPRKHAKPLMTAPGTPRPAQCKRSCAQARHARVCTHWRLHAAVHNPLARRITTTTKAGRQPHLTAAGQATCVHNPSCNDPVVLTHARALLTCSPPGSCDYIEADVRDAATVLAEASRTLDSAQPVAVLLLALLHFVPDGDDPGSVVAALADGLAPGSFVAVSHLTGDFAPEQVAAAVAAYNTQVSVPVTARTHAEVCELLGELPLAPPGVVPVVQWRPPMAGLPQRRTADLYAGLACVPGGRR
jgi:S-adenosyl methyltransferase